MRSPTPPKNRSLLAVLLLGIGLFVHFFVAQMGWETPGLMGHGFRQAQTALTIDWMKQEGFRLDYSTPVLGKPWSIPMEFPLYQWFAVRVSDFTGWPTAQSGRAVGLLAFYLGLPAWWLAMRFAGVRRQEPCLLLLPVLAVPLHLFYARAVLIESLAWSASSWFLACGLGWRAHPGRGWLVGVWLAGAIAALVKGTTWAVFVVPLAVVFVADVFHAERGRRIRSFFAQGSRGALLTLPPLVVGLAWVAYADRIKAENPLAGFLVSGNLASFNFGSFAERVAPGFWSDLCTHWNHGVLPWWGAGLGLIGAVLAPARWRWVAGVALAGFVAGPLVFANLYRIHDYYHFATAGFGAVAVAAGLVGLASDGSGWRRWVGASGLVALLVGQATAYRNNYFGMQTMPFAGADPLAIQIERLTLPGDVIVVHGTDWSSELPYYAKRRALVVPDGQLAIAPDAVERNIRLLADEHVALVVFKGPGLHRKGVIERRLRDFSLWPEPLFAVGDDTLVFAAESDFLRMATVMRTDENASGVRPVGRGPTLSSGESMQELGARFAGAFPYLHPAPARGILPFGYVLLNDGGRRLFMANVPTTLEFPVPGEARIVELDYRVFEEAFTKTDFAGARFVLEMRGADGSARLLLDDWIGPHVPVSERGLRHRELVLPQEARGTLVFRTLAGPEGNAAFGWAVLDRLEVR